MSLFRSSHPLSELILPVNSSLSGTIDQADLRTVTSVCVGPDLVRDRLWLNGREEDLANPRLVNVFAALRARCPDPELARRPVHVVSSNSFPTAAGLASSASGYACLVFALAQLYNVSGAGPSCLFSRRVCFRFVLFLSVLFLTDSSCR